MKKNFIQNSTFFLQSVATSVFKHLQETLGPTKAFIN